MTKVGAYSIIRVYTLVFGGTSEEVAWIAQPWLVPASMITLVVGALGVLASRSLGQMVSFAVIASMGTLLMTVGAFTRESMTAALYYMLHSTLAAAALFLIVDLVAERRPGQADLLSVAPRFHQTGLIAGFFFVAAIAMAGLPPLSGFLGKLLILDALREAPQAVWMWALILVTSLLIIVGFARGGSTLFWKSSAQEGAIRSRVRPRALPYFALGALVAMTVLLTAFAGPVMIYLEETAYQLFNPGDYQSAVLFGGLAGGR
jgi:multicomponent K+:H+ antiporter subunit D